MPSLIKGANVVWKDSVTLENKIIPKPIKPLNQVITGNSVSQDMQRMNSMQNSMKFALEEEYRKKNEGLDARYKMLLAQVEADKKKAISEAKIYAKQLIEDAEESANSIKNQAQEEYDKTYNEAKEKGFQDGRAEAMEVAQEEYEKTMQSLKNLIEGINENEKFVLEKAKSQIGNLAVEIFRKIIAMNMDSSDMFLQNMITDQLRNFKDYRRIKIYLNGFNISREVLADTLMQNNLLANPDLLSIEYIDEAQEGTCIIETENEMADISISEQLENLIKNVRNVDVSAYEDEEYDEDENY